MSTAQTWRVSAALGLVVAAASVLVPRLVPVPVAAPPAAPASPPAVTSSAAVTAPSRSAAATAPSGSAAVTAPSRSSPRPTFRPIRIAASDPANDLIDVEATDCPTCASGSRVKYVGQGHALILHVRDVPAAGRRTLVIVYESEGIRPLDVIVNGGDTVSLRLPGKGNWITPARHRLPIDLPAGDSEITFFHATAPAPDLDQFLIE